MNTQDKGTTNPAFDFYYRLFRFLNSRKSSVTAEELAEIARVNHSLITLEGAQDDGWFRWLKTERGMNHRFPRNSQWMRVSMIIVRRCFVDLSAQMRTAKVRKLFERWVGLIGAGGDTFIHVRNVIDLGDEVKVVTMVVAGGPVLRNFTGHGNDLVCDIDKVHLSGLPE